MKQFLIDYAILARNFLDVTLPLRRLRAAGHTPESPPLRFLIIPGDPACPAGSLGDMAMFTALMHALRARHSEAQFTIIGTHAHSVTIPGIGDVPVAAAWGGSESARAFDQLIRQHCALFVMAADILDGKYGASLVTRIVSYCNHSVALGIPATTLGFSFNRHPRHPTVRALASLNPAVTVNVRDGASLERFRRIVGTPARLCADSAFLMPATHEPLSDVEDWLAQMRAAGYSPVGVNLNAHALAPVIAKTGLAPLLRHMADQLARLAKAKGLAYLLIPHDFKKRAGDVTILKQLEHALHACGIVNARYAPIPRPDLVKRIAGRLDLVITGRMHLAIAALGSGTPVVSIAYQDKFEGLYQHFGLALDQIVEPLQCLDDGFAATVERAWARRDSDRERIAAAIPGVETLARRNLDY